MKFTVSKRILCAAAVSVSLLLAGCSGGSSPRESGPPAGIEATNALDPATGDLDELNWDMRDGEMSSMNPIFAANFAAQTVLASTCDQLQILDADFNVQSHLGTVTQTDDKTVTIDLVEGAKFWNGDPVTAEDAVYSLKQHMRPDAQFYFAFTHVSDIEATGPLQVTVRFSQPDELFVKELASPIGMVWSKKFAEEAGKAFGTPRGGIMCSGPLVLKDWTPGQSMTLVRNEDYWNEEFRARSRQVNLSFVSDTSAVIQGLLSGQFDGAWSLPPASVEALEGKGPGRLTMGESTTQYILSFTKPDGVTADPQLRQALLGVVDREGIAKAVFKATATPSYTIVAPNYWDEDEAAREIYEEAYAEYESSNSLTIDEAKKLVDASDYDGSTLTLAYTAGNDTESQMAQLIQAQFRAIGVKTEVTAVDTTTYITSTYTPDVRHRWDLMMMENYAFAKDPLEFVTFFLEAGQPFNWTEFDDPEVMAGLEQLRVTFDAAERATQMVELQRIWEEAAPMATLGMQSTLTYVNDRLSGVTTSSAYMNRPSLALIGTS